jgi:hypothetical protein
MQSREIALDVDKAANGTVSTVGYTRFDEASNRSTYIGPNHTLLVSDQLTFYRSFPKRSGNFNGSGKCRVKISRDVNVPGADKSSSLSASAIMEMALSLPVGISSQEVIEMLQTMVALLSSRNVMDPLTLRLDI